MERITREKYLHRGTDAPVEALLDEAFLDYSYKRLLPIPRPCQEFKRIEYSFAGRTINITVDISKTGECPGQRVSAELGHTALDGKEYVAEVREKLEKILFIV